jgi:hypothetical protein
VSEDLLRSRGLRIEIAQAVANSKLVQANGSGLCTQHAIAIAYKSFVTAPGGGIITKLQAFLNNNYEES